MIPLRSALRAALPLCAFCVPAHAYPLIERERVVTNVHELSRDGLQVAPQPGDTRSALVLAVASHGSSIVVFGGAAQGWARLQSLPAAAGTRFVSVQPWASPAGARLVAISVNAPGSKLLAEAIVYAGRPLREERRFTLQDVPVFSRIADVDADGEAELVTSGSALNAYALSSGSLQWSAAATGAIEISQFDKDPALEIVATSGQVLDGTNGAQEWSYASSFADALGVGRLGADGRLGFVAARTSGAVDVFAGPPWATPLWTYPSTQTAALSVADLDGAGLDEIVHAGAASQPVVIVDSSTRLVRHEIAHPGVVVGAFANGALAPGAGPALAFSFAETIARSAVRIVDPISAQLLADIDSDQDGIGGVALADLDGNGSTEQVIASGGLPGSVRVFDQASGALVWTAIAAAGDPDSALDIAVNAVVLVPTLAGKGSDIALVGHGSEGFGRIVVLDGRTGAVRLRVGGNAQTDALAARRLGDADLFDFDEDGNPDLVVSAYSSAAGAEGAQLLVFDLSDDSLIWASEPAGASAQQRPGLLVLPTEIQGNPRLVLLLGDEMRAFQGLTGDAAWTYKFEASIAALFADAAGGPEIITTNGVDRIDFHDAVSLTVRRSLNLDFPLLDMRVFPGEQRLLGLSRDRLLLLNPQGEVLTDGGTMGDGSIAPSPLAVLDHDGRSEVLVGTGFGYVRFDYVRGGLFADGFE